MIDTPENDHPPLDLTRVDRRRPGRVDYRDPHLIALLRGQSLPIDEAPAEADAISKPLSVDDLAPARGILTASITGAAVWAGIIFALRYFL